MRIPRSHVCSVLASLAAALLFTSTALSQEQQPPEASQPWRGFYLGGGGNYSTVSVERPNSDDCDYGCYPLWGDYTTYEEGDGDYGYSVHAGLRLHQYFALEAAYIETGTIGWDENLVYMPDLKDYYNNHVDFSAKATEVSALAILPFFEAWEVYLRVGAAFWDGKSEQHLDQSFGNAVVNREVEDSGTDWLFGLGLGYTFADAFHVRFEATSFNIDREVLNARDATSVDSFVLELQYRFGAH